MLIIVGAFNTYLFVSQKNKTVLLQKEDRLEHDSKVVFFFSDALMQFYVELEWFNEYSVMNNLVLLSVISLLI